MQISSKKCKKETSELHIGIDISYSKRKNVAAIGLTEQNNQLIPVIFDEFPHFLRGGGIKELRQNPEIAKNKAGAIGSYIKGFCIDKGGSPGRNHDRCSQKPCKGQ